MGAGMSIQAWGRPGEPGALLATQVRILEAQASLFSNLEKDVLGWISARMEKSI
jgi:hypothetical protein